MNSEYSSSTDELRGESEITILPDGRIYVLGLSRKLADLLNTLNGRTCESQTHEESQTTNVQTKS